MTRATPMRPSLPRTLRAFTAALLLLGAGCNDLALPPPSHITYPRVLAMRAEVEGEPERATPAPGETLRLRVLVVGPEPLERISYTLEICPARPERGEVPACLAPPFVERNGLLEGDEALAVSDEGFTVDLEVPGADAMADLERLLVVGTVCTEGTAQAAEAIIEPGECEGSDETPVTWVGHVTLQQAPDDKNLNPSWADDAVHYDDQLWVPPPTDGAAGSEELEAVAAEKEPHFIAFDLSDSGREQVMGEAEELRVSHFATAGRFARGFTVLEHAQPDNQALAVEWHGPPPRRPNFEPPDSVTFVMVLRDGRGGVAFTTRTLAVRK